MHSIFKFLTNPKFTVFGIIFGPIFGIFFKEFALKFAVIYNVYLSLMQLAVIPLIIVTVMSGVLELSNNKHANSNVIEIISKTLMLFIAVSIISIVSMLAVRPWTSIIHNPTLLNIIYKDEPIIQHTSINIDEAINIEVSKTGFGDFISSAIPSNIFNALSNGEILQVIIFFSIVAVTIVSLNNNSANNLSAKLNELMAIFRKINDAILSILPFLSFFIISYQLRLMSIETIYALLKLVLCIIILMSSLIVIFISIVAYKAHVPLLVVLQNMGKCIILAFISSSTLITSGLVVKIMSEELKFDKNNVQLIVPIGAGLLRFGTLSIYLIAATLTAYLFSHALGVFEYIILMFASIFATLVSISANNSVAFYQTLPIVMSPLGLPSSSVQTIMISIDFLLEPLVTITNVLGISALCALYAKNQDDVERQDA